MFRAVTRKRFIAVMAENIAQRPDIADSCSAPDSLPRDASYFLSQDGRSGFGVKDDGDLIAVHSVTRGQGAAIVWAAIRQGATTLDCFDGYLPGFYARFGFRETRREANWTAGEPDVVFMAR